MIQKVLVIGPGTMGSGIAQVLAQSGAEVILKGSRQATVDKGIQKIEKGLQRALEKGKLTENGVKQSIARITGVTELTEKVCCVYLVIEAIVEDLAIKKELFQTLGKLCPNETILSSNTSSLSITALGAASGRPDRVIGMHFFNPVPAMKLVEIVMGLGTSEDVYNKINELAVQMGKSPVKMKDSSGFVGNRLVIPMINEAIFTLMEGVSSAKEIDAAIQLGFNHPMGPLALADLIGNDVVLAVMETLYRDFGDSKYRPCPLLKKMVEAGYLGRKVGRGFYEY